MTPEEQSILDERRKPDRRAQPDRRVTPESIAASLFRRISWQALVVGTLIALAVQVMFFVLGMAIGIYTPPATGSLVTRIGIWQIIMMLGGLMPAGYIAARMAGIPSRLDSALHGAIIWTITILTAPSLGGRIGAASAFAIPGDLTTALWAFAALAIGLAAAMGSAYCASPTIQMHVRKDPPTFHIHPDSE